METKKEVTSAETLLIEALIRDTAGFNDWGGRGYDDFIPGEVTETAPSGDETT